MLSVPYPGGTAATKIGGARDSPFRPLLFAT